MSWRYVKETKKIDFKTRFKKKIFFRNPRNILYMAPIVLAWKYFPASGVGLHFVKVSGGDELLQHLQKCEVHAKISVAPSPGLFFSVPIANK